MNEIIKEKWEEDIEKIIKDYGNKSIKRIRLIETAIAFYIHSIIMAGYDKENTAQKWYYHLKVFKDYLYRNGIYNIKKIKREDIIKFFIYSKEEKKHKGIYRKHLKIRIRNFFNYLEIKNIIKKTPFNKINYYPQVIQKSIRCLNILEIKKIIKAVNKIYSKELKAGKSHRLPAEYEKFIYLRDSIIIRLLISTGIRPCELRRIREQDIDWNRNRIKIEGKGNNIFIRKERYIYIDEETRNYIMKYIEVIKERKGENLVLNNRYKNIRRWSMEKIIKKYIKVSGIKREISAYTFRHTFCSLLITNGADIYSVQKLMGHKDVSITLKYYLHLSANEVRENWKEYNPLKNINEN